MTGADLFILLILLGSTLIGALRGFIREAVSVAFWILAIWAAWQFGPAVDHACVRLRGSLRAINPRWNARDDE